MDRIDKYELLEMVGRGGMGVVYKAFHPHLKKYVAIKEIRSENAGDPASEGRFEREAEILARLPAHPNLVMVRDALVWQGRFYLVMDFIDGADLGRVFEQGPVPTQRAVKWLNEILSGLEAIHERGIVHRDLKPGNILIDREAVAYISDFGIAELTNRGRQAAQDVMLTAKYAAPEMIDPAFGRDAVDTQADVYAAGMLAYEMLLGPERFRQVFSGIYAGAPGQAAERWLRWHTDLSQSAPHLAWIDPQIPAPLANLIERMMSKDTHFRHRDATEARRDLKEITTMTHERPQPIRAESDDQTMRLDRVRPNAPRASAPQHQNQPTRKPGAGNVISRLPKWALPAAAIGGLLLLLILPWLLYAQPGFTVALADAPPNSQVYVDDVLRGIPGLAGENAAGLIRIHGLKAGISHSVRVKCSGGGDAAISEGNRSIASEGVTAQDGETKNLKVMNCGPDLTPPVEVDYNGKMRLVAKGLFWMGANDKEEDEKPLHQVQELIYDYYIDQFEVSNKLYREICSAPGGACKLPSEPFWDKSYSVSNPDSPVVGMSWDDARNFCEKAGKRLPTEAEWEKAASWDPKATDDSPKWKRRWPWGNAFDPSRANFNSGHSAPVNQYAEGVSAYGVYNMAGNASEWVADIYNAYPGSQYRDPDFGGAKRVVRGGAFQAKVEDKVRTTWRDRFNPYPTPEELAKRAWLVGFRCAVKADDVKLKEHLKGMVLIK
jgi:serine/threonine protein kinase/formylglycine-generating enzyme required for sulfatase activity